MNTSLTTYSLCVCLLVAGPLSTVANEPLDLGSQRQLFLDDYIVERIDGLKRTMHQPAKRGAVIKPDQEWEVSLQTRCAPAWDEQRKVFKTMDDHFHERSWPSWDFLCGK